MHRAFRHADEVARLIRGHRQFQRAGVREPHILTGKAHHAPRYIQRGLPGLQHAGQPVHRRVGIGVAHAFVQGGDQVVVLLALFIVQQGFARQALLQHFHAHPNGAVAAFAVEHGHLQHRQGGARVAVCKARDHPQRVRGKLHVRVAEAAWVFQRAIEQTGQILLAQGVQDKHPAARQQRAVDFKGRIFRSSADQNDAALFHKGQKRVLLGLVEAVNFVHKDQRALAVTPVFLGLLHYGADLADAAGHGGKVDEGRFRMPRDDARQRGLAHARRTPEDHGGEMIAFDQAGKHLAGAQQVTLAHKFVQRAGTKPCGQGLCSVPVKKRLLLHAVCLLAGFVLTILFQRGKSKPRRARKNGVRHGPLCDKMWGERSGVFCPSQKAQPGFGVFRRA